MKSDPVATAPGADTNLVSDSYAEASAVITIVVIIDSQNETAVYGNSRAQIAADQVWLAELSIRHANVSDQSSHARAGDRSRIYRQSRTARTVWPNVTY